MSTYNWHTFTARININSTFTSIYEMWATAAGMEKWFLRMCEIKNQQGELKPATEPGMAGDQFLWRWFGWPDEVQQKGEILEANGTDRFAFTFGQDGAEAMTCLVKIYTEEGETICQIVQDNMPDDEKGKSYYHIGCLTGWSFFLANMKSILEGGVDLRNKNERLTKMINS